MVVVVGVSLDNDVKDLNAYLAENPLSGANYQQGGLDSRPANAMGILTISTMILVDPDRRVISNIAIADLEAELKKLPR